MAHAAVIVSPAYAGDDGISESDRAPAMVAVVSENVQPRGESSTASAATGRDVETVARRRMAAARQAALYGPGALHGRPEGQAWKTWNKSEISNSTL